MNDDNPVFIQTADSASELPVRSVTISLDLSNQDLFEGVLARAEELGVSIEDFLRSELQESIEYVYNPKVVP